MPGLEFMPSDHIRASQMRAVSQPRISAAIICYNEEERIGNCLDSLRWCDQIVVVDSGSTDATQSIIRSVPGVELHERRFDNFINQKNHALSLCRHDWVISLDADEVLTEPLVDEIRGLAFDQAGYRIGRRSYIGEQEIRHGTWSPDYQLRLFRRSAGCWGGTNPHESFQIQGSVGHLKHRMLHYSYRTREEYIERNTKYVHMMVDHLAAKGSSAGPLEPYTHCVGNFLKAYVLRAGFLDGSTGLFLARHIAGGAFLKYRLLAERAKKAA